MARYAILTNFSLRFKMSVDGLLSISKLETLINAVGQSTNGILLALEFNRATKDTLH